MADHPLFSVSVVTPEGAAFEGDAEMLIVPGAAGEIGVLARHAPLVAMLKAGSTRVHTGSEVLEFATGPGFFKVETDRALALVDDAVRSADVDPERARTQLEEARAHVRDRAVGLRAESRQDRLDDRRVVEHDRLAVRVARGRLLPDPRRNDERRHAGPVVRERGMVVGRVRRLDVVEEAAVLVVR